MDNSIVFLKNYNSLHFFPNPIITTSNFSSVKSQAQFFRTVLSRLSKTTLWIPAYKLFHLQSRGYEFVLLGLAFEKLFSLLRESYKYDP
jgi:hypothetical protein